MLRKPVYVLAVRTCWLERNFSFILIICANLRRRFFRKNVEVVTNQTFWKQFLIINIAPIKYSPHCPNHSNLHFLLLGGSLGKFLRFLKSSKLCHKRTTSFKHLLIRLVENNVKRWLKHIITTLRQNSKGTPPCMKGLSKSYDSLAAEQCLFTTKLRR